MKRSNIGPTPCFLVSVLDEDERFMETARETGNIDKVHKLSQSLSNSLRAST